jgi:formate hydrogenlyase subunit 6/NADH:ubiquinone oxidoreductase subunit I
MNLKNTNPGRISAEVLRTLFKKPATIAYRGGKLTLNDQYRGLLSYDPSLCVACGLCMKDCPTGALQVINDGTREEKKMRAVLDTGRCIFCGQCADSCARKALHCTPEADLAGFSRGDLKKPL